MLPPDANGPAALGAGEDKPPHLVLPVERSVVGHPLLQSGSTFQLCGVPREQSSDRALRSLEMGMKGAERET